MDDHIEQQETGIEETVVPTETTELDESQQDDAAAGHEEPGEVELLNKKIKGLESAAAAERHKRQDAERRLNQQEETPTPRPVEQAAKPRLSDFEDHESYYEALTDYKIVERDTKMANDRADANRKAAAKTIGASVADLHSAGRSEFDDWDAVVNVDGLAISETMRDSLLQTDNGQAVFYHLGKNPELSLSIARMQPLRQAMEIAKIETKLTVKAKKTTTNAPDPIKPVGAKSAGTKMSTNDLASKDPVEFIRQRNEGLI